MNHTLNFLLPILIDQLFYRTIPSESLELSACFKPQVDDGKCFNPKIRWNTRLRIRVERHFLKLFRKFEQLLATLDLRITHPGQFSEGLIVGLSQTIHNSLKAYTG